MTAIRDIQEGLRAELRQAVGRQRFRLWFRDTAVADVTEDGLTLAVPTEVHRTWLQYTYGDLLREACERILGEGTRVRLKISEDQERKRAMRDLLPERPADWKQLLERRAPKPTLESFYTRPSGRFPVMLLTQLLSHSGAQNAPSIYLYGEGGSGKTHLLAGLHTAATRRSPGSSLLLSVRHFTSRYVSALRAKDIEALRAFRMDLGQRRLILLDGIEALSGREATQGELVRLVDRSLGTKTRLVLAGTSHPREQEGLSSKLRSRLLGGIVLRLEVPRGESLDAILERRARAFGFDLPAAVRETIVARTISVRGAVELLDRWGAVSAEIGRPLEAPWMDEIVPGVASTASEEVIRRAKDVVAEHFGIRRALLDEPTKIRSAAFPRRLAMYLVYRACALPLTKLGHAFGLRSHSSVSRAIHEVRERRETDADVEHMIDGLLSRM